MHEQRPPQMTLCNDPSDLSAEELATLNLEKQELQQLVNHINTTLGLHETSEPEQTAAELSRLITTLEEQDTRIHQMDEALEMSLAEIATQQKLIGQLRKDISFEQAQRAQSDTQAIEAIAKAEAYVRALEIATHPSKRGP